MDTLLYPGTVMRKIRACEGDTAAQLVLEQYAQAAVLAEREAIAKLVESATAQSRMTNGWVNGEQLKPCQLAAAIRARGE